MSFTLEFDFQVYNDAINRAESGVHHNADQFLSEISEEMTSDLKLSYTVSPSAPWEPPGVDTGNLRAGTRWWPEGDLLKIVGVQAEYGPHLEFGIEGLNLAPRPFIGPLFEVWRARFPDEARRFDWNIA